MERIGVRELRQHASKWLERVQAGESFEVTDRGRLIAWLVPAPEPGTMQALIAAGEAYGGDGDLSKLPPPLPAVPGRPLPAEILAEMRRDER